MSWTSPLTVAIRNRPAERPRSASRSASASLSAGFAGLIAAMSPAEELRLFRLHERREPSHRFFHHARGFHHLRQEHLARAEQVAHHPHAIHQRTFDHFERTAVFRKRRLGVFVDESVDALEQRVFQALFDRPVAPREILLDLLAVLALEAFGQF